MRTIRRVTRWIVAASLLLGLSTTSLYPRPLGCDGRSASAAGKQTVRVCCCGKQKAGCGGTVCCQVPNPGRENAPVSTCPPENRGEPLALALLADSADVESHAAPSALTLCHDAASSGGRSLIVLGIRLNV